MLLGNRGYARSLAAAVPHRPGRTARLRGRLVLRPATTSGGSGRCRGQPGLPPRAQELRRRPERRRALALVLEPGRRIRPEPAQRDRHSCSPTSCSSSSACRRWPSTAGSSAGPSDDDTQKTQAAPSPCTRSRTTRPSPAGHRHQALQAARRVQLDQDLRADRRPRQERPAASRPATHWREIFEDRRQYVQAADAWKQAIEEYGPGQNNYRQQRLDQIVGNWGRFEPVTTQPAGKKATVDFRFRNGKQGLLRGPRHQRAPSCSTT